MKAVLGKTSFYENQKKRIEEFIKEPMLMLVLQYLPHLQLMPEEQDSTWAIIAVNLNNLVFKDSLKNNNGIDKREVYDSQMLTGVLVKEMFEKIFKSHIRRMIPGPEFDPTCFLKTRCDFLLHELYKLRSYDAEVLGKLGAERYEETQRKRFNEMMNEKLFLMESYLSSGEKDPKEALNIGEDTKQVLEQYKDSQDKIKLEIYEQELAKKNLRIEKLMEENKKLLELNHSLLERPHR